MNKYEILLQGLLIIWKHLNKPPYENVEIDGEEKSGYEFALDIFREGALEILMKEAKIIYPTITPEMLQWNIIQIFNLSRAVCKIGEKRV